MIAFPDGPSPERIERPSPADPAPRGPEQPGPVTPDVDRPASRNIMDRMRKVDPKLGRNYRQRSGQ